MAAATGMVIFSWTSWSWDVATAKVAHEEGECPHDESDDRSDEREPAPGHISLGHCVSIPSVVSDVRCWTKNNYNLNLT